LVDLEHVTTTSSTGTRSGPRRGTRSRFNVLRWPVPRPPSSEMSNLYTAHPGNTNAATHGLHSSARRVDQIGSQRRRLIVLPWTAEIDEPAIDEVARLLARIEAVEWDLESRGNARTKTLLENRVRLSRELRAGSQRSAPSRRRGRSGRQDWHVRRPRNKSEPPSRLMNPDKRQGLLEAIAGSEEALDS
jgi:hypothetical protein